MKNLLSFLGNLIAFGLSVFQLIAIVQGVQAVFGWHIVFAIILGVILAPVPILGTVAAIWCATHAWGWSLSLACQYFLIPLAAVIILTRSAGGFSTWSKIRH